MVGSLFSWLNYLDDAVLACPDQSGPLPVQNLASPIMGQLFRTTATSTYFTADLQASQPNRVFGLFGLNLAAADTIQVRLSDTTLGDGDVYDSTALPSNAAAGYGQYVIVLPDDLPNARYLRVDINAPSREDAGGFDIKRAWIGNGFRPSMNFSYGWSEGIVDPSTAIRAQHSGQRFNNKSPKYRTKKITYDGMNADDKAQILEMQRVIGITEQVLFVPDTDGDLIRAPLFGTIASSNDITEPDGYSDPLYSAQFMLNEDN